MERNQRRDHSVAIYFILSCARIVHCTLSSLFFALSRPLTYMRRMCATITETTYTQSLSDTGNTKQWNMEGMRQNGINDINTFLCLRNPCMTCYYYSFSLRSCLDQMLFSHFFCALARYRVLIRCLSLRCYHFLFCYGYSHQRHQTNRIKHAWHQLISLAKGGFVASKKRMSSFQFLCDA